MCYNGSDAILVFFFFVITAIRGIDIISREFWTLHSGWYDVSFCPFPWTVDTRAVGRTPISVMGPM